MRGPHVASGGRYPVLRAFAIIYLVMAVVALLSGLVAAGWALIYAPWDIENRVVLALLSLAGSFFLIVGSLAVAEIIKLFIDIEHNTRIGALRSQDEAISAAPEIRHSNRFTDDEETAEAALIRGR